MRYLLLLLFAAQALAGGSEQFDKSKPGYRIGKALEDLTTHTSEQYFEDLKSAAKYATTSREADLSQLAVDFLGCALSSEGSKGKCTLKGKLSRYGYYEPLALRLNKSLTSDFSSIGSLFRCAVEELQERITHAQYLECIDIHPPKDK